MLFALSLASTNLIQNGGFEDYASEHCSNLWCRVTPIKSKEISPWKADTGVKLLGIKPHNGTWAVELRNQWRKGGIGQTVATKPNSNYALKFWVNIKSHCQREKKRGIIKVVDSDDSIILEETFFYSRTEHRNEWLAISYDFKAKSEESKIVISNPGEGTEHIKICGLLVDSFELYEKTTNKKCKKRTPPN